MARIPISPLTDGNLERSEQAHSLEIVHTKLPISPVAVQTFNTTLGCFLARVKELAVRFAPSS